MSAPKKKRTLPAALARNLWKPGQSGNPSGYNSTYGEVMKLAGTYAVGATHRLAELAGLNQLDDEGRLVPLSDLPDVDHRVVAVAANAILDRAFGKPKVVEEKKDDFATRVETMTPAERLQLTEEIIERGKKYLPLLEAARAKGLVRRRRRTRETTQERGGRDEASQPAQRRRIAIACAISCSRGGRV